MQTFQRSAAFIKRRKLLLMYPVLILPFLIILFYLLGGGKDKMSRSPAQKQTGLNLQLPDPHFLKRKEPDKLDLYEGGNKDSDRMKIALRNDPYLAEKTAAIKNILGTTTNRFPDLDLAGNDTSLSGHESTTDKEKELLEKLNKLKEQLSSTAHADALRVVADPNHSQEKTREKISNLTEPVNSGNEPDQEITQLNQMLDKVAAIQHSGAVAGPEAGHSREQKSRTYPVSLYKASTEPASFGTDESKDSTKSPRMNRFYGLMDTQQLEMEPDNAIQVVVPESQTLVSGSTIKLRLLTDIRVNGQVIPKDQFIYGLCSVGNDRMEIRFCSIRLAGSIFPVSLAAYDLDGLAGIFIPGSITRDAVKQSGNEAINSLGLASLDPSVGAQAASAGIQTAKTLLGHKVKLVKITVRAGYQLLLKDERK
jgi:conjugative transposon TraM protein